MAETRAGVRRRLRKASGLPPAPPLDARSRHRPAPLQTQIVRVAQLLAAARLEVTVLLPSDFALRRAIVADLDAMLTTLQHASVQAAASQLPDMRTP
jgi:hypothetical protein